VLVVGKSQRQQVVRLDIQLPQQIFLPRRNDFAVDGFHIRICEQAQHTKVLDVPYHVGKLLDHMLVAEVPAQNDLRHLEVILHDRNNLLGLLGRKLELVENHLHAFSARVNVVAFVVTMRLADIVKQQGQQQQLRILQLIQHERKPMAGRQLFDISNRDQRMLVDRVLMKEISNNAAADLFEIRKDSSEQTGFVHREQRIVDAL